MPNSTHNFVNIDTSCTIASTLENFPRMKSIIAEYVQGLADEVRRMQDFLARGDMSALKRVVHQLRGTGGGYGFDIVSDLAAEAEDAIIAASDGALIALKVNSLISVIRRIDGFAAAATRKGETS